jgi:hypothetical protein
MRMDGVPYGSYNYECAHVVPLSEALGHGAHMSHGRCYSIRVCHPVKYFLQIKEGAFHLASSLWHWHTESMPVDQKKSVS